jgi:hypothetical protein
LIDPIKRSEEKQDVVKEKSTVEQLFDLFGKENLKIVEEDH